MNDDQIRSLLRDARVTEPMPAAVSERLDDVLAGLRDSSPEPELAPVVPLRRRVAPRLLAAAAAVVLVAGVGVGLQQVLQQGELQSAGSDNAATADRAVPEQAPVPAPAEASKSLSSDADTTRPEDDMADRELLRAARRLSATDAFSRLLEKSPALQGITPLNGVVLNTEQGYAAASGALGRSCAAPFLAALPGSVSGVVPTSVGRSLLVVGPDQGGDVHVVELWGCTSHDLVARETLDLK